MCSVHNLFYLLKLRYFVIFINITRACSSVVERCPDKTEVEGPIPSMLTMRMAIITILFVIILLLVQVYFFFFSKDTKVIMPENVKNIVSQQMKIK